MMREAIVLCGGEGSRLKGIVEGPKCLVRVGDKIVLERVLDWLAGYGVEHVVLCPGPFIVQFAQQLGTKRGDIAISYAWEGRQRLGTGGAAAIASAELREREGTVPVLNGDTVLLDGILPTMPGYVRGINRVTGEPAIAFRVVSKARLRAADSWLASSKPWGIEDDAGFAVPGGDLSFIDIGTPEGLVFAQSYFRGEPTP